MKKLIGILSLTMLSSIAIADNTLPTLGYLFNGYLKGNEAERQSIQFGFTMYIAGARDSFYMSHTVEDDDALVKCVYASEPETVFDEFVKAGANPDLAAIPIMTATHLWFKRCLPEADSKDKRST